MVYISVGRTVVAAFNDPKRAKKALKRIAPGCNATIKKCRHSGVTIAAQMRSKEARRSLHYLKPGDFSL